MISHMNKQIEPIIPETFFTQIRKSWSEVVLYLLLVVKFSNNFYNLLAKLRIHLHTCVK